LEGSDSSRAFRSLDAGGLVEEVVEVAVGVGERLLDEDRELVAVDVSIGHLLGQCFAEESGCIDAARPAEEQRIRRFDRHSGVDSVPCHSCVEYVRLNAIL